MEDFAHNTTQPQDGTASVISINTIQNIFSKEEGANHELKSFLDSVELAGAVRVDPQGWTHLGVIFEGQSSGLRCTGKWVPGQGHPSWGPEGDPTTTFNGAPKWCVLFYTFFWDGAEFHDWQYGYYAGPLVLKGHPLYKVHVKMIMNDDKYDDNINDTGDPMTAWLG